MYFSKLIRQDFCLGRGKGNADNCNFICISHYIPNLELLYQGQLQDLQQEARIGWEVSGRGEVVDSSAAMAQIRANVRSPIL